MAAPQGLRPIGRVLALSLAACMEEAPRRRLAAVAAQLAGAASTAPSPIPPADTPPSLRSSRLVMAAGHDSVASMRAFFEEEGYLLFPRFLAEEHVARITADMDSIPEHHHIMRDNPRHWWGTGSLGSVETPHLGGLTSHPPAVAVVAAVAFGGFDFAVHHIHAHVHYEGDPGVHWRAPLGPGPHPCACWHPPQPLNLLG